MWAFAVLDPSRNVLFLSRDRFGIKPLYYWSANGTFCFASEIKALRAVPTVDPKPDRGVVAKYLRTGVVDDTERTFFAGILQLPPAHNMSISIDGSLDERPWRYLGTARRRWRRIGGRRHRAFSRGARRICSPPLAKRLPSARASAAGWIRRRSYAWQRSCASPAACPRTRIMASATCRKTHGTPRSPT